MKLIAQCGLRLLVLGLVLCYRIWILCMCHLPTESEHGQTVAERLGGCIAGRVRCSNALGNLSCC